MGIPQGVQKEHRRRCSEVRCLVRAGRARRLCSCLNSSDSRLSTSGSRVEGRDRLSDRGQGAHHTVPPTSLTQAGRALPSLLPSPESWQRPQAATPAWPLTLCALLPQGSAALPQGQRRQHKQCRQREGRLWRLELCSCSRRQQREGRLWRLPQLWCSSCLPWHQQQRGGSCGALWGGLWRWLRAL